MSAIPGEPEDQVRHPQQPAEGDAEEVDEALRRQERRDAPTGAGDESASDADAGDV